ncbi:CotH kinase family protein [Bacteroides sp.]|uniref:CotH kinase family protein n=1 Tax=Bacteroides sp. TaxID=29523 RepID=UPI0026222000|nr:CotH kinase family protein [Bacteroides sp.]
MKFSNLFGLICLSLLFANCSDDSETIGPCPEVPEVPFPLMYQVAQLTINTENAAPIVGKDKKDYVNCTVIIDSEDEEWDYTGTGRIRGRGNSTWLWYPKKPYRIKLDKKSEILGLAAEKDWVLLANYRDPTQMMNNFTFIVGEKLGLPYTNHSRYVEVTLNGEYIGLYQLTEQVEQGSSRVAVDDEQGILISLDADDGPELNPDGGDNFWSTIYRMPICVKYPEEATTAQLKVVQDDFAQLEQSIREGNYETIAQRMNIASFIDYMLIQELVYNVEVDAPRSIYMHKDKNGLWTMGPLWDFDAGFDFDWGTMYTGHNYFASYRELVLGTDPVNHTSGYHVPNFFTDLFNNKRFVKEYKARWTEVKGKIMKEYWEEISIYEASCFFAMGRNVDRWPIDKSYAVELSRMKQWLEKRIDYLDTVIKGYPAGTK